jgi:Cu(I)/Ag(I) efflux system membrane fusion protein
MSQDTFEKEGGLRAPPGLGFWGKAWWWFHFLILVKIARLRFLVVLLVIGLVIVKWDLLVKYYDRWLHVSAGDHADSGGFEWFCPMHPQIVRDNPKEKCPICFMPLSKRKQSDAAAAPLPAGTVSRLQLSPYRVVLAGVQTSIVAPVALHKDINTVGFVEFNEREMKHVAARAKGRLDKLFVNETGQMVHAGDALASLYSPGLLTDVETLLSAHRANNADLLKTARGRLTLFGVGDEQIDEILKTGKSPTHLTISAPITGHVLKKYAKEGQYVDEGSPLYDVVDLSTVWIQAQVYEDDMAYLPGDDCPIKDAQGKRDALMVSATSRAFPNETFEGRLTFIFPHVDLETRSVLVRFELPNPDHKLRPGTSVAAKIQIPVARLPALVQSQVRHWQERSMIHAAAQAITGTAFAGGLAEAVSAAGEFALLRRGRMLAVPETAVIDTGAQKLVYRQSAPGEFEGVLVEFGPKLLGPDDIGYYPVLGGVAAGDRVVTAGSFLIDAESRLNPAAGALYAAGNSSTARNVKPSTPAVERPKSDDEAQIAAGLAKLPGTDRRLAQEQRYCAVNRDNRLGAMGAPVKLVLQGEPVFLCCEGCRDGAMAQPQKTVDRVRELRAPKPAP